MSDRIIINPDQAAKTWRVAMFAISNMVLSMHRTMSSDGALGPTEILIYVTIATANVQKLMRERTIPESLAGTAILPREWVVPISRNAIAESSGLPRETVRRNVAKMIAAGLLIEDERGGVTGAPGMIQTRGLEPMLEAMLADFIRASERLIRIGAIELRKDAPPEPR